ncbi:hypothetical protein SAMN05443253_113116 [Bacillus sp. OK048]|nr:hypothetical protein SAMN05443253_113116 [Bacillus sp. OK048]
MLLIALFNPTLERISLPDMDKNLDDTAKELVYQQKEGLEVTKGIAIPDTFENLPLDPFGERNHYFSNFNNSREIYTNYEYLLIIS